MYKLALVLGLTVFSARAETKKAVVELSRDPVVRAEFTLNDLGHVSVAQINEFGERISASQSVTTKSLRVWQRLNRDDTEQVQSLFVVDNRVFAVTYPYQEVAPRYGTHESRLHEFKVVHGRTRFAKFGIGVAFTLSALWSMPLFIIAPGLIAGNHAIWEAAHGWLAQAGSIVYLGTLGATGWLCRRSLTETRGVHASGQMTPVEIDEGAVHVAQIIESARGKIDDIIYKTKSGRTGSLREWIERGPPESVAR